MSEVSRWNDAAFEYSEIDRIRDVLVGRSITNTLSRGSDLDRVLSFVLDDGTVLNAHAADGGCACSNGCFTVEPGNTVRGTILNVEIEERATEWSDEEGKVVEPGSVSDGSATIRLFVYTDLGQQTLVTSEGSDNGYYGWGFWLSVDKAVTA